MDVRRGTSERKIHFDSSTMWTKGTQPRRHERIQGRVGRDLPRHLRKRERGDERYAH